MSPVGFRVLACGSYGGAAVESQAQSTSGSERVIVAGDPAHYRESWDHHVAQGEIPVVDFSRQRVVFLLLGQQSTGGYAIETESVKIAGDEVTVTTSVRRPGKDSIVTMAFTSPYCVIAVDNATFGRARWVDRDGQIVAATGRPRV